MKYTHSIGISFDSRNIRKNRTPKSIILMQSRFLIKKPLVFDSESHKIVEDSTEISIAERISPQNTGNFCGRSRMAEDTTLLKIFMRAEGVRIGNLDFNDITGNNRKFKLF